MQLTRRQTIQALCAGSAQLLYARRIWARRIWAGDDAVSGATIPGGDLAPASAQQAAGAALPGTLELQLAALSPNTLRISISPANDPPRLTELGLVDLKSPVALAGPGNAHATAIPWGRYTIRVTIDPLRIAVFQGETERQQIHFAPDSTDVHIGVKGPVFGMGEGVHPFDRRNTNDSMSNGQHAPDLETFGSRVPIPWLISPDGWGVFIGQPQGIMAISSTEAVFRCVEATSTRNVYLLLGDTPADVLREYADLSGHPHLPPLWSFGYQQSHRTLASHEEIVSIAQTFRDKKLPCDALIYLGTGFCPSGWNSGAGSFTFNQTVFPNPPATIKELHDRNLKVIVHMVPPGDLHGAVTDTGAEAATPGDASTYWAKHVPLVRAGVDGWWPDEGDRLSVYARLARNRMYWDGPRAAEPSRRPFALHRNGYAGLQRYGWLWSGDTFSTWAALRAQIMVGINIGLSGIPYWGSDTGGFVPTLEYGPELFVRWFQFSAFCPSFRCHGRAWKLHLPWGWNTGETGPREMGNWEPDWPKPADLHRPDVEVICRKFLELRYQLLPSTYTAARQSHETGLPIMRALWLAYPKDEQVHLIDDSYLWGDHLLVAPVHSAGATTRELYLPEGDWWNYWTAERLGGGKRITTPAPLDSIPLFVKAGAVVPIGPIRQYTAEPSDEPVTLRIYPGADGHAIFYDDDGTSFRNEHGEFLRLHCTWNDAARTLTLERDPAGSLGKGRTFRVELAGEDKLHTVALNATQTRVQL